MKKLRLLFMLMMSFHSYAQTFEVDGLYFKIISSTEFTCGVTRVPNGYSPYEGSIDIPSSITYNGEKYKVIKIFNSAFSLSQITEVNVNDGIEEIENAAFFRSAKLKIVNIGKDVYKIGLRIRQSTIGIDNTSAFYGCTSLEEINVDSANETYMSKDGLLFNKEGSTLFCVPAGLEYSEFIIPKDVTYIRNDAFEGVHMGSLDFNGFNHIQSFTFGGSTIDRLIIPPYISSLPGGAFETVKECVFDEYGKGTALEYNYDWACWPFASISKIEIYRPIYARNYWPLMGRSPFKGCGLRNIICDMEDIPAEFFLGSSYSNVTHMNYCPIVVLGDKVRTIGNSAFEGCYLVSIIFPDNLQEIGDKSFKGCFLLEKVEYGKNLKKIGKEAFYGTELTEICLPSTIEMIGDRAFNYKIQKVSCYAITPPIIPDRDVFGNDNDLNRENFQLYVPGPSLNDYKQANGWNKFSWVRPIPGTELISFSEDAVTITSGENYKLTVTTIPEDASVFWTSSNPECVTVNSEGVISGIKGGTAVVTASIYEDKKAECFVTVRQGANELKFDIHDLSLSVGEEYKIQTTILPENTFDKTIKWGSSDNSIATVDDEGKVIALKAGIAIIKGSMNKIANDSCKLVVIQPAESISLQETVEMYIGASLKLTATVLPEDVTDKTVTWSTSDAAIATVDTEGNVTAIAVGEATITASCGDKSATCKVTVNPILAESITLDKTELTLTIGASEKLTATVLPEDVTDKTIIWSTSDASIATVDTDGNVTAVAVGEATITTTCGDKSATCKVTVNPILAESITLDKTELTLTIGASEKLTATVLPEDVTDKAVTWSTSDASIATVDAEGNVTAISVGEATITTTCGDKSATCKVTVNPILAESITLDKTELTLTIGASEKLTATVLPEDVTDKTVTWSTSDESIATVDTEGNVTAIALGEATITATCGDKSATCKITVDPILAESITLDKTELTLTVGASEKLTATVLPEDVTDKTIIWSTSDASIATVDAEGNVTAIALGEATITAKCGDKSATCKITVDPILAESITLDKTELTLTVGASEKLTATVLPEDVTDKTIIWSTSDESIATVDTDGNVTAISVGEATITATCGDKSATCKVTVNPILAESITLDKTELTLTIGATDKLTATVLPEDVTDKTIIWSTSDESIAKVDTDGNVTAVSIGEAAITATCGETSATCLVFVENTSGLVAVAADGVNIIVNGSILTITGVNSDDKVTITRQDGAVIYSGNNRESYTLVRGLYLVIVNGATYKVVIH